MGANWACTLLGLVFLLLCPIPIVFRKYGAQLRRDSHFAPGLVSDLSRLGGLLLIKFFPGYHIGRQVERERNGLY